MPISFPLGAVLLAILKGPPGGQPGVGCSRLELSGAYKVSYGIEQLCIVSTTVWYLSKHEYRDYPRQLFTQVMQVCKSHTEWKVTNKTQELSQLKTLSLKEFLDFDENVTKTSEDVYSWKTNKNDFPKASVL